MSGGTIMAILSPLKVTNQFVSPKSMNIRESIETVIGFLLVAGFFYYDCYTEIKISIGALIFVLLAFIISF